MKKFLRLILFIEVFCFFGMIKVNAATLTLDKSDVNTGESVILTISNATSNSGYNLIYDSDSLVIDTTNNSCSGPSIEAEKVKNGCSITFSVKKMTLTSDKIVFFELNDKGSSDHTTPAKLTIKANKTTMASTTATTTTQAPKSNNANLKTLVVKTSDDSIVELTPKFDTSVTEYSATVPSNVKTINIETTMEDSHATAVLSKNATEELKAGENNKIIITVTAEDGTKRAYTLNIKREALTADATLRTLIIKEAKNFKLVDDKYTYKVKVNNNVKALTLDIETTDDNAIYEIEGNEDLKDGSVVKITVTAEDGTKKVYTLNISKVSTTTKSKVNVEAEKNPLIIMGLSIIAFGLIGGIIYVIKK